MENSEEKINEAMEMLFAAKWNLPYAAKISGLSYEDCKTKFNSYCKEHPITWKGKTE